MTGHLEYDAGTKYTCVDSHPDTLHGGQTDKNGHLFYLVEARCGSLRCPPYVEGRELTGVVCSKKIEKINTSILQSVKSLHNVPGISIKQLILSYSLVAQ